MSVRDFEPRGHRGVEISGAAGLIQWLDRLSDRQNIDLLNPLTGVASGDELYIFDVSANLTLKTTVASLAAAIAGVNNVLVAEQATTSVSSIDFTGIPAGVKQITVMLVGVSTNGVNDILIQLGDAGGPETSGYSAVFTYSSGDAAYSAGFGIVSANAANVFHGALILTLEDASDNTWLGVGTFKYQNGGTGGFIAGSKATSAVLDRIRLTTVGGTDAFDAGVMSISYST